MESKKIKRLSLPRDGTALFQFQFSYLTVENGKHGGELYQQIVETSKYSFCEEKL